MPGGAKVSVGTPGRGDGSGGIGAAGTLGIGSGGGMLGGL